MSTAVACSKADEAAVNIRLRRLNSTTSSTYSSAPTLPQYSSTKALNPFISPEDDASTISETIPIYPTKFFPTTTLQIHAQGKRAISLPTPSKELEIPIYAGGPDGEIKYLSLRPKRSSGSCTLINASDTTRTPLAQTKYFFGPGSPPRIQLLGSSNDGEEFTLECKSLLSRNVWFESPRWGRFEWRYARRKERNAYSRPAPNCILLLEKVLGGEGKEEGRMVVARLVRGEETRTMGSRASSAGNGGLLEMCLDGGVGEGEVIDEVTVLAGCFVMLKKEIDRLRGIQIMIICGAAGSS